MTDQEIRLIGLKDRVTPALMDRANLIQSGIDKMERDAPTTDQERAAVIMAAYAGLGDAYRERGVFTND